MADKFTNQLSVYAKKDEIKHIEEQLQKYGAVEGEDYEYKPDGKKWAIFIPQTEKLPKLKDILSAIIDEHFPKLISKERGEALLLVAKLNIELTNLFKKLIPEKRISWLGESKEFNECREELTRKVDEILS